LRPRADVLRRAIILSAISIGLSAVVGVVAVLVALATDSLSLLGFGVDAAIDSAASVVLVWRFRIETLHPHRAERVERLAEVLVGAVLIGFAIYLAVNAVNALIAQSHPALSPVGLALLAVSILALPPLAVAKYRTAVALASGALRADSVLTAVAAILAAVSLVSLGLTVALGFWWADAVGALFVAAVLAREGWGAFRSSAEPA
jgi:divalent metal cation (Fe/Co/Zn/Cd) transporter